MLLALQTLYQANELFPSSIPSEEAFGTASVAAVAAPSSIPSAEAFGLATVIVVLSATSIPSAEAFGTASVTSTISATSIPSAEAFGTASVASIVSASSIPSAETFGTATATFGAFASSIPSAEAFGLASVFETITVSPSSIPSAEAFGHATALSTTLVSAFSIPSEETFGLATATGVSPPSPVPGGGGSGGGVSPAWRSPVWKELLSEEAKALCDRLPGFESIEKVVWPDAATDADGRPRRSRDEILRDLERARRLVALTRSPNSNESMAATTALASLLREKGLIEELIAEIVREKDAGSETSVEAASDDTLLQLLSACESAGQGRPSGVGDIHRVITLGMALQIWEARGLVVRIDDSAFFVARKPKK